METNGHKKCEFTDDLVAYLYDEMPAAGRPSLESHLSACRTCTDEFAGLSQARFEVFDWRREEFDTLATPVVTIPYPQAQPSFIERVTAALSWGTLVPVAAALLVVLGIGYVLLSSATRTPAPQVAEAPLAAPQVEQPAAVEVPSTQVVADNTPSKTPERSTQVVQAKAAKRPVSPRSLVAKRVPRVPSGSDVALNLTASAKRTPRLGTYDDDDDDSLRLSELFEEAGPPK